MPGDSLDKIVGVYFAGVAAEPFEWKGAIYPARQLHVSPLIFRDYTCPPNCGACCMRGSLDWLPSEEAPGAVPRWVKFNGRPVVVLSDEQKDHHGHSCRHLTRPDGRCSIHGRHPMPCDFEMVKVILYGYSKALLTQKLFGRGWAILRVDGERGARCEMLPGDERALREVLRKLYRLADWTTHFGLRTHLATVIDWVASGPHDKPLVLEPARKRA